MRINTNTMALNTYNQYSVNTSKTAKSIEKLSSGLAINSAADDAAGLAISEKMRSQIRGLEQASQNAQDGISLVQTAEGALNETESILQRMRELAVQAENDTNTADDREAIQQEINQLVEEIDRISDTTEFNSRTLLNGNAASLATVTAGSSNIDSASVTNASLDSGVYTLEVSGTANQETANLVDAGTGLALADVTLNTAADASYGSYQLKVEDDADNTGRKKLTLIDASTGEEVASANNIDTSVALGTAELNGIQIATDSISGNGTVSFDVEGDHTFTLKNGAVTVATATVTDYNKSEIEIGGLELSFNADVTDAVDTSITIANNSLTMQIGANAGQTMNIAINDMSASALGIDNLDLSTSQGAEAAITSIDDAIKTVSNERAKLGAYQNRLEHTINNLNVSSENLTAAESGIRDVDMAKEMMEYTKYNVLQQSANTMLAQANQQPQQVLKLLG